MYDDYDDEIDRERESEDRSFWCLFHILFAGFLLDSIRTHIAVHWCIGDSEYYCERSMPIVRWCLCALHVCVCLCSNISSTVRLCLGIFVYVHFGACMCVCCGDSNASNVVLSLSDDNRSQFENISTATVIYERTYIHLVSVDWLAWFKW